MQLGLGRLPQSSIFAAASGPQPAALSRRCASAWPSSLCGHAEARSTLNDPPSFPPAVGRTWSLPTASALIRCTSPHRDVGPGQPAPEQAQRCRASRPASRRAGPAEGEATGRAGWSARPKPRDGSRRAARPAVRRAHRACRPATVSPAAIACPPPAASRPRCRAPRSSPRRGRPQRSSGLSPCRGALLVERDDRRGLAESSPSMPSGDDADHARMPAAAGRASTHRAVVLRGELRLRRLPAPLPRSLGAPRSAATSCAAIARASSGSSVVSRRTPSVASPTRPPALIRGPSAKPQSLQLGALVSRLASISAASPVLPRPRHDLEALRDEGAVEAVGARATSATVPSATRSSSANRSRLGRGRRR